MIRGPNVFHSIEGCVSVYVLEGVDKEQTFDDRLKCEKVGG